jgi:aldehyde oxidoreductase
MAEGIGFPPEKIRIIMNPTGGSFGWSISPASYALTAVAAMAMNVPVSLSMSYEEHQHFSGKRAPSYANVKMGCDKQGKITAMQYDMGIESGPYTEWSEALASTVITFMGFPYNIPNIEGMSRVGLSNHNYCVTYRAYGSPQTHTSSEAIIDMLAEKAGIDPLEFRMINVGRQGEINVTGVPFRQMSSAKLLEMMRPVYEEAVARAKAEDTPEKRRGVGIAFSDYGCSAAGDVAGCKLELLPNGDVAVYNTWEDLGQGGDVGSVMVVTEALKPLGLKAEQVRPRINDSKTCPDSGPAAGSRSHVMNGRATIETAKNMLDTMRKPDGTYRTYDDLIAEGLPTVFEGSYSNEDMGGSYNDPNTGYGDMITMFMYGLYLTEVEVDTATGKTKVLGVNGICDVGKVGNMDVVLGQAYGGLSHSIGFALSEDYKDVKKHTNIATTGAPTIDVIPDNIKFTFLDSERDFGPFGSAGCSEMFQAGAHTAITNAIYNACGVRIHEIPATPAKVKEGLDRIAAGLVPEVPEPYFLGSTLEEAVQDILDNPISMEAGPAQE